MTLHKSKYVEIEVNLKSWGVCIDWYTYEYLRPVGIQILCFTFEFGQDPYPEESNE